MTFKVTPSLLKEIGKIISSPVGVGVIIAACFGVFACFFTVKFFDFGSKILHQANISNNRLASIESSMQALTRQQSINSYKLDLLQDKYVMMRRDVDTLMLNGAT